MRYLKKKGDYNCIVEGAQYYIFTKKLIWKMNSMHDQIDHTAVKAILNTLRRKIARRTSDDEAVSMLSRFIDELTPQYGFLKYVSVNKKIYSENESIWVAPELSDANQNEVFSALHQLVKKSVFEMKEKADFFFIREFQDAFEDMDVVHKTMTDDIPLDEMQHEYLINRAHTLSLEKNQLIINVIHSLLSVANTNLSENESVQVIEKTFLELLPKYPFFHSVNIVKNAESKGYYTVELSDDFQKIPTFQFADALFNLIYHVGTHLDFNQSTQFQRILLQKLGQRNAELLRKLNVPIDNIIIAKSNISQQDIMERLIDSLIELIGERTSEYFAVAVMMKMIGNVKKSHDLLTKIQISKNKDNFSLQFADDFNSADETDFQKTAKSLIQAVGAHLGKKRGDFIEELKKKLGKEYVSSFERMGLNFHILEMKLN